MCSLVNINQSQEKKEIPMDENTATENIKQGQYYPLPDGTEVLIENEIITDPAWVSIELCNPILGLKDRQIRVKMKKLNWLKKYAVVNNKCSLFLNRAEIEKYAKDHPRDRIASIEPPKSIQTEDSKVSDKNGADGKEPALGTPGNAIATKENIEQVAALLGPLAPHIKDFVDSHKKDQDRLRELEAKRSFMAVITTSLCWAVGVLVIAIWLVWINFYGLSNKLKDLSTQIISKDQALSSKDAELLQAKTDLLNEKDAEIKALRVAQINAAGQPTGQGK